MNQIFQQKETRQKCLYHLHLKRLGGVFRNSVSELTCTYTVDFKMKTKQFPLNEEHDEPMWTNKSESPCPQCFGYG